MDAFHNFSSDLVTSSIGDLFLTDGITLTKQRLLRRLLTNPGSYIFHPNYGAGVASFIGQNLTLQVRNLIKGLITQQMYLEPSISQTPPPTIEMTSHYSSIFVQVTYTESSTKTLQVLTFKVGE